MAALHSIHSERYGLGFDNYIGTARLVNKWDDFGYDFFRRRRIFGFLDAGMCDKVLTGDDRRNIERFAERLEELVPPQAPSLCHGDLWKGNVLLTEQGLRYFDPAPHYGWAEADLAVTNFPEPFYGAYVEASGVERGWRKRSEVYLVREYLIMTSLFGDQYGTVGKLRELLEKYA